MISDLGIFQYFLSLGETHHGSIGCYHDESSSRSPFANIKVALIGRTHDTPCASLHHKKPVDYDAVVQKFAEQQPRRMLLADPIFEES